MMPQRQCQTASMTANTVTGKRSKYQTIGQQQQPTIPQPQPLPLPKAKAKGPLRAKKKRVSTRLFNEPSFPSLLSLWQRSSPTLGSWSTTMHALLKKEYPELLGKYGYYESEKKVHLCQYLFEKSGRRKGK
jgi:hypothetical protein